MFGGVIGSKAEPDGEWESVLSSVRLSGPSADNVPEDPVKCVERREPRPKAADKCDWCDNLGDGPLYDWETTSVPGPEDGGLSFLDLRVWVGESDLSSNDPAIYVSVIDSSDAHGLGCDSELRGGPTELRNGTSTDSSMSSYIILTA